MVEHVTVDFAALAGLGCRQPKHTWQLPAPSPSCSSYVPEPKTFLHHASAEAKQLWIVAVLLITASAPAAVRLAAVALLLTATIAALPRRLWGPQLRRLAGFCALLFVFTAIGRRAEGCGTAGLADGQQPHRADPVSVC